MPLSEKAKGKQRAVDPHPTTDTSVAHLADAEEQSRDLVIRFTEGIPDLVVAVGKQDAVRDVKRKIREGRTELKDRRLRLIHSGRLLTEGTFLYSWLASLEERQKRAAPDAENGGPQPPATPDGTTWVHCSVGPKLEPGEEEEGKTQTAQLQPARGFDRLSSVGFSEADIANFRRQFHSQSSSNYLDIDFETEEEYDEHARALEEQWIDSIDNAGTASLSQSSPSNTTVLQGILLGFFFPLIPFFFMRNSKPAVFWDDGSEYEPPGNVIFSRRMQMGHRLEGFGWAVRIHLTFCMMSPRPLQSPQIQGLPPELWGEIFIQSLPNDGCTLCSNTSVSLVFSQVSNSWRAISLSLPRLWSSFKVVLSKCYPTPSLSFIQLWLDRSASRPLSLLLDLDIFPPTSLILITAASAILRLLATKSHLWKELKLVLPGSYMLLQCISDCAAPNLKTLELVLRNWQHDEIGDISHFLRNAPTLQQFVWSNRENWGSWDSPFVNTALPRMNWHNLHHLVLDSWITFQESHDILQLCHNLITCDLRRFGAGEPFTDPALLPVLYLPHLKSLKIYQHKLYEALGYFLELLAAPQLHDLSITCGQTDDVVWPQRHFMTFLSQSSCLLKVLCLEYTGINEEEVMQCLQAIPTLACLEVYDVEDDICAHNKLLSLLTQNTKSRGVVCPNIILH
ncbi:DSC E3 ubiquitin ligase complex subunit 3 [Hypsizygus marmoreus]|uniref:DSC E3 ubiquitin ligase complex subunit 3 n=1 Tax=Hypsizygus marmoreus TaxID=39966 RepID=A0A369JZC2_HYPMA|nr:DSC E3 ubiquitin ligase complex subunit 3 [Hypsizygus marmoreus]